jgi:hypothetical protein
VACGRVAWVELKQAGSDGGDVGGLFIEPGPMVKLVDLVAKLARDGEDLVE